MLKLRAKALSEGSWHPSQTVIAKVTRNGDLPPALRGRAALLTDRLPIEGNGFAVVLTQPGISITPYEAAVALPAELHYLDEGDVVRVRPNLQISVLYRRRGKTNSLLVTERCNSFCLMCSQPPRDIDDSYLIDEWLAAIPLFDRWTHEIGITGGEPTLLGDGLPRITQALKAYLPETSVHILSNGRNFRHPNVAQGLADVRHHDVMVGIPLYSDIPAIHDYVVQADGAFDETIRGILELKRRSVRVELRVVLHKVTYLRLPALADFIVRNLQFVDQVALMGLEITGFTKVNLSELWIDPVEYQDELSKALDILRQGGVRGLIYNHQLCVLAPALRQYAVKSISDWKNEYLPECNACTLRGECGGFFSSAVIRKSAHISPIAEVRDATNGSYL